MATIIKDNDTMPQISLQEATLYDSNTRTYLLALTSGRKPDTRPDCGLQWSPLVDLAERAYVRAEGDITALERWFVVQRKREPALDELLKAPSAPAKVVSNAIGVPELPEFAQLPAELSRGACTWLDKYEAFSKEASPEGYKHFHVFCGLWLLSTVAGRRVHLIRARKHLYTNLMIALFSESSEHAKSTTAEIAIQVLEEIQLGHRLLPKRISPQKMMSDMAGVHLPANYGVLPEAQRERVRQRLAQAGQRTIYRDEFGKFVRSILRKQSSDAEYLSLLLEFDNCPKNFDGSTFSRGGENIESPYLSLLGCMTPPDLKDNSKSGADFWNDGFWGRFAFVAAPKGSGIDATSDFCYIPTPPQITAMLMKWDMRLGVPDCIIDELTDSQSQPTGKFTINREPLHEQTASIDAQAEGAYKNYRSALKHLIKQFNNEDFNSNYKRLPEIALRMALLMASLENNNHIEIRHWARAQELAEILRASLHEMYAQVNTFDDRPTKGAAIEQEVMEKLEKYGAQTIARLRCDYLKKYSVEELTKAIKQMTQIGMLEALPAHGSNKYRIKPKNNSQETEEIAC